MSENLLQMQVDALRVKKRAQERLDAELADLPRLEAELAHRQAVERAEQEHASALSEVAGGLAAVVGKQAAVHDAFIAAVQAVTAFAALFAEREESLVPLARRCNHAARLSAHRRLTQEARDDPMRYDDERTAINREAFDIWQEAGGCEPELAPFPETAFVGNDDLEAIARLLASTTIAANGGWIYDPRQANEYLRLYK